MSARILIAGDDPDVRNSLREALPRGWTVISAGGAAEALAAVEADDVEVLLLALRSEAAAYDLARALRRSHPDLVILVFVGCPTFEGLARARASGVDGVFAYPTAKREVAIIVEAHLELGRERREAHP